MTFADVQLIRFRLQKHVPRAGSFEVYSSPITLQLIRNTLSMGLFQPSVYHLEELQL